MKGTYGLGAVQEHLGGGTVVRRVTQADIADPSHVAAAIEQAQDDGHLRDELLLRAYRETGARKAELISMRLQDLDQAARELVLHTLKWGCGRKERVRWCEGPLNTPPHPRYYTSRLRPARAIPVTRSLIRCFQTYVKEVVGITPAEAATDSRLLFGSRAGSRAPWDFSRVMNPATAHCAVRDMSFRAGLRKRIQVKSLRHLFVTELLHGVNGRPGLPKLEAIIFTGHRSPQSLDAYDHIQDVATVFTNFRVRIRGEEEDLEDRLVRMVTGEVTQGLTEIKKVVKSLNQHQELRPQPGPGDLKLTAWVN